MVDQTLHEVAEMIRERALVVVISDLLFDPAMLRGAIEHLAFRKHDVAVFSDRRPFGVEPELGSPRPASGYGG